MGEVQQRNQRGGDRFLGFWVPIPASCRLQLGQRTPDFSLPGVEGKTYQLDQSRGKPLVLAFIRKLSVASGANASLKALETAYPQFVGLGANLWVVTSAEVSQAKRLQQAICLPMPLLCDPEGLCFRDYGTGQALGSPLPAQFVLDSEGKLRWQHLFSLAHPNATPQRLLWAVRNL